MFPIILTIHIIAGSIALVAGTLSMIFPKGRSGHRTSGKIFTVSMILTGVSAISLSILHPSNFLLAIGLFTLYLVISGWVWSKSQPFRYNKRLLQGIGFLGVSFAAFMLYRALVQGGAGSIILLVFGGILLILAISDFTIPKRAHSYVVRHAGRMGGAYIAAVTAFVVVNGTFLPDIIVWLGPTVIGSVILSVLINKTETRMRKT